MGRIPPLRYCQWQLQTSCNPLAPRLIAIKLVMVSLGEPEPLALVALDRIISSLLVYYVPMYAL